jgi:hypothetical protein
MSFDPSTLTSCSLGRSRDWGSYRTPRLGYGSGANAANIMRRWPFFRYCKAATATSKTGSTIYVGAPIGTAQALAVLLNGKAPPVNECRE